MTLTADNIGPEIYELFHEISEGLQGRGRFSGSEPDPEFQRKVYLSPGDSVQTSGEPLNLMLHCPEGPGIYSLRDIFLNTKELRDHNIVERIRNPKLPGYSFEEDSQLVFTLRGLNESQIHFYGNQEFNVDQNLMQNFSPINRRNLGRELAYCFDEFLSSNPKSLNKKDIGPQNVPYVIDGKNGSYEVRLLVESDPKLFINISLEDIVELVKK